MVKKMGFSSVRKPDVTPPSQLREQKRWFRLGLLQGRARWGQVALSLVIGLLLVAGAAWWLVKVMWAAPGLDTSKYQAVFLDDGKVFFGKLRNTDGAYITLENAYYTKTATGKSDQTDQTALIKVGSEPYGPENSIQIARSHILFWQNLRTDSQITQAINNKVTE